MGLGMVVVVAILLWRRYRRTGRGWHVDILDHESDSGSRRGSLSPSYLPRPFIIPNVNSRPTSIIPDEHTKSSEPVLSPGASTCFSDIGTAELLPAERKGLVYVRGAYITKHPDTSVSPPLPSKHHLLSAHRSSVRRESAARFLCTLRDPEKIGV